MLFRKHVTRATLIGFLAALTPCIVSIEACTGAHYEISMVGHSVRLIAPAYVKRQKNKPALLSDGYSQRRTRALYAR